MRGSRATRSAPGFNPLRYEQTSDADWAVLTVTETLPAAIEPLRLRRELAPSGTKAVLVGYPQDRAFAMTADRDCELREKIDAGRLFLHTCRGIKGYFRRADPGQRGRRRDADRRHPDCHASKRRRDEDDRGAGRMRSGVRTATKFANCRRSIAAAAACGGADDSTGQGAVPLEAIRARLGIDEPDVVSSIPAAPLVNVTWLASEPFAIVIP